MTDQQDQGSPDVIDSGRQDAGQLPELPAVGETMGLAILRCAGIRYGIDVKWVREIRPYAGATPVPGVLSFWSGITTLRGHLYPVLDLRQFLFPQRLFSESLQQIAFTAAAGLAIGLLAEEIAEVLWIDAKSIMTVAEAETSYVLGITPDQVAVLDLPTLFADPRLAVPVATYDDNVLT